MFLRRCLAFLTLSVIGLLGSENLYGGISYFKGGGFDFKDGKRGYTGGVGSRYQLGPFNALDIAWQGMWLDGSHHVYLATPRASLLVYLNPCHSLVFYLGGAASWAHTIDTDSYSWKSGAQIEGIAGVEIGRNNGYLIFLELTKSFPKVSGFGKEFCSTHSHFASLSLGIGF